VRLAPDSEGAKSRFTEEHIVAIARAADRNDVASVTKRHGISEQTIYTWRRKYPKKIGERAGSPKSSGVWSGAQSLGAVSLRECLPAW
jgi:transposase-like protein